MHFALSQNMYHQCYQLNWVLQYTNLTFLHPMFHEPLIKKCDYVAKNAQENMGSNSFWWKIVDDGWSSSLSKSTYWI
jgi:hypothetical protein